jgi:hypothetical protein
MVFTYPVHIILHATLSLPARKIKIDDCRDALDIKPARRHILRRRHNIKII